MQHLRPNTTLQGGKYRIERVLGQGGFGNTYVGFNTVFNERVAIKEFFMQGINDRDDVTGSITISIERNKQQFQEQLEKFKKEALRIRKLDNPHIVKVHDLFEENGTAYYVMDYVDGENLAERLKRTGKPMSEQEIREILPQILDALKSVHDAGIWHLDLKPANIMVDKSGIVKLIDFGASKQLNAQKGGATTSTAISYTNGYAPREQMEQNYDKFGPWTDIYALGATLYNLLTNKRPPLPTDIDDDISEDKHEALPFPDSVSGDMRTCILQMMKTNRMQRPQSVDSIIRSDNIEQTFHLTPDQQDPTQSIDKCDDEATIIADPKQVDLKKEVETHHNNEFQTEPIINSEKKNHFNWFNLEDIRVRGACFFISLFVILLLYGTCNNVNQAPADNTVQEVKPTFYKGKVYDVVEEMPQYPGGPDSLLSFIQNNTIYPVEAEENGIEGEVVVTFIIEADGCVNEVKVANPVHELLDSEAVRVVKSMPKWIPGKQNGSAVRVMYTCPFKFRLE